jgi:hypothetical protein
LLLSPILFPFLPFFGLFSVPFSHLETTSQFNYLYLLIFYASLSSAWRYLPNCSMIIPFITVYRMRRRYHIGIRHYVFLPSSPLECPPPFTPFYLLERSKFLVGGFGFNFLMRPRVVSNIYSYREKCENDEKPPRSVQIPKIFLYVLYSFPPVS